MPKLQFLRLECTDQEDWTWDDHIRIYYSVDKDGEEKGWLHLGHSEPYDDGTKRDLDQYRPIEFSSYIQILLKEIDWVDPDDKLGVKSFGASDPRNQGIDREFTQKDAIAFKPATDYKYTLKAKIID